MKSKYCLIIILCTSFFLASIFIYAFSFKRPPMIQDTSYVNLSPMQKTLKRIEGIRKMCGDLCDTSKEVHPGDFLGYVTSKVDCDSVFQSSVLYQPDIPPQNWGQLPQELQEMFSYGGRIKIQDSFHNTAYEGEGRNEATVFTKENVDNYISAWLHGSPNDTYINGSSRVAAAAEYVNVTDKTILVMGTQEPWLEAVLLTMKPRKIVTLEYGYFISEYPGHTFMRPREFRERYLNRTLNTFGIVFTYSSLEHSGLGRYGDPLNPWGDILAVAEAWCVSKPSAKLAIGVPTIVGMGYDINVFNVHRMYGPIMYPFLTSNWRFVWPSRDEDRVDTLPGRDPTESHPVFVFEKINQRFLG